MSADNWAVYPRCKAADDDRIAALKRKVEDGYGHLPLAEFDVLRAEAEAPQDEEKFRTFREDYEFWGAGDGVLRAEYEGTCQVCKLSVSFAETKPFWPEDDAQ